MMNDDSIRARHARRTEVRRVLFGDLTLGEVCKCVSVVGRGPFDNKKAYKDALGKLKKALDVWPEGKQKRQWLFDDIHKIITEVVAYSRRYHGWNEDRGEKQ